MTWSDVAQVVAICAGVLIGTFAGISVANAAERVIEAARAWAKERRP
jgi:hypothetical protein